MSVKFRLGFTVDAETMFSLMAKLLPIDDLSVEEVIERPAPRPAKPKLVAHAKPKRKGTALGTGGAPNLADGVNDVIMRALADGEPHRYRDLKKAVVAAGYRVSGIGSRLGRLREQGVAVQAGLGLWRKT